jgi:hypothetical protein
MAWTSEELQVFAKLGSPKKIQDFLDGLDYNTTEKTLSPREVLRLRLAHCFDGALFAAVALEHLGQPPMLMDLRAVNDDDHVVAVFREKGLFGAVAKSNTTLLRYRDPVFRSPRELALSYFPFYFNTNGDMALREYSRTFSLRRFGADWRYSPDDVYFIAEALDRTRHYPLLTKAQLKTLPAAPGYVMDACFLGADWDGFYKAKP